MSSTNKITISELEHIAKLARLSINKEKENELAKQLSETTAYIENLEELNTEKLQPTFQVNDKKNVFRNDDILPSLSQDLALSQAPEKYNGYFKTEATIKK